MTNATSRWRQPLTTKPEVGDVIKHDGDNWVVPSVEAEEEDPTVVTLRPEPKPA